jgi:hypothetical protein
LEGSAVPDGVLEIPAVTKSVAHVLVVRALGVEDVVQRALASTGSSPGARGGWSGGVYFLTRPLLPAFVGWLVRVTSWCCWCRLCSPDEILGPLVGGDVEVEMATGTRNPQTRWVLPGIEAGVEAFYHPRVRYWTKSYTHRVYRVRVRLRSTHTRLPVGNFYPSIHIHRRTGQYTHASRLSG